MTKLIVLGETHHGIHLKEIKRIFKSEGHVDGIFVEKPINYQKSVDNYLANKIIDEKLESHFEGAMREGKNIRDTMLFLLNFARSQKIPVVCVDSSKVKTDEYSQQAQHGYYFLRGESRDEDMFTNIIKNIKEGEKWLMLCGAMHLINKIHHRTGKKTLGEYLRKRWDNLKIVILR